MWRDVERLLECKRRLATDQSTDVESTRPNRRSAAAAQDEDRLVLWCSPLSAFIYSTHISVIQLFTAEWETVSEFYKTIGEKTCTLLMQMPGYICDVIHQFFVYSDYSLLCHCDTYQQTVPEWKEIFLNYMWVDPLEFRGNYSATSNNIKLVHWPLMGGLLHLVQSGGAWVGCSPAQAPPRCTNCNSPLINGQYTNHRIAV